MSVVNGVTIVPASFAANDAGGYKSLIASFFTAYVLSSTSDVYNQAGGQAADSGLIVSSGCKERLILYKFSNFTGAATLTMTVYGRINGVEAVIVTIPVTAATSGFVTVTEGVEQVRVGIKISANAATVTIVGRFTGNTTIEY